MNSSHKTLEETGQNQLVIETVSDELYIGEVENWTQTLFQDFVKFS